MARPLRIEVKEGWHQVINRGIERRRIFKSAADCDRFMKVLADFPSRFDVRVHAYALMRKQTMGRVVSELARQGLQQPPAKLKIRGGIPVLPKRSGVIVTYEFMNWLRQEHGT